LSGAPSQLPQPPRTEPALGPVARLLTVLVVLGGLGFAAAQVVPDLVDDESPAGEPAAGGPPAADEGGGGGEGPPGEGELASARGLEAALAALGAEEGEGLRLTNLVLAPDFATFDVLRGDERVDGYRYAADGGELTEVDVLVVGTAPLGPQAYPLGAVEPDAVDRIVARSSRASGSRRFAVESLVLRRDPVEGRLRWTLSARAGDRIGLTYRARADGSGFEDLSAGAIRIPDAMREAEQRAECVREAGDDVEQVLECVG